jgi:hypothetical protein
LNCRNIVSFAGKKPLIKKPDSHGEVRKDATHQKRERIPDARHEPFFQERRRRIEEGKLAQSQRVDYLYDCRNCDGIGDRVHYFRLGLDFDISL